MSHNIEALSTRWLSKMQFARSSTKRARSPAAISGDSASMPSKNDALPSQLDECGMSPEVEPTPSPQAMKPPSFLRHGFYAVQSRFQRLQDLEAERLQSARMIRSPSHSWAELDHDLVLDRYYNVHPWANHRVRLEVPVGVNDYINASPVTLTTRIDRPRSSTAHVNTKFICMQGPKYETVDHVWHMIWHSTSELSCTAPGVIIMLTPTHVAHTSVPGNYMEKCYQYYPSNEKAPPLKINETSILGEDFKASVRFVSKQTIKNTSVELRELAMTVEGHEAEKTIWHFLYPDWPDFGAVALDDLEGILQLMRISRDKIKNTSNPRIVHCSAGIGRTGTFIALEFLIGELQSGAWEKWDEGIGRGRDPVFETINQLRIQRQSMVQAPEQYFFIYEALKRMWKEKYGVLLGSGEETGEPRAKVVKV